LAVLCGAVSGGLEMLELEGRAVAEGMGQRLVESVHAAGLSAVWQRIVVDGYAERTPSGGVHLIYRLRGAPVSGNVKLARRPAGRPLGVTWRLVVMRHRGGLLGDADGA
jgi:putative DNA primase/helicase